MRLFFLSIFLLLCIPSLASARVPDDSSFPDAWYLKRVQAPLAWDTIIGSKTITVAVIDTGIDIDQPDLEDNIWVNSAEVLNDTDDDGNGYIDDLHGWDFLKGDNDPHPDPSDVFTVAGLHHGTVVSGIIGAVGNNALGGAGISWRVRIMPLRVLDGEGVGLASDMIRAMEYAIDNGADVINLSLVGTFKQDFFKDIMKRARDAGILVVAASGNDNKKGNGDLDVEPRYPICSDGTQPKEQWVIGVAALNSNNILAPFANFGSKCVDLSAPGVAIPGLLYHEPNSGFVDLFGGNWSGTSLAAPQVSGAAALLKAAHKDWNRDQIIQALLDGAVSIDSENPNYIGKIGKGLLNIAAALAVKPIPSVAIKNEASNDTSGVGGESSSTIFPQSKIQHIVIAPLGGDRGPLVTSLNAEGVLSKNFFAYEKKFKGGVSLATADVDGDGEKEIITGAGPGGGPQLRIFSAEGILEGDFFAYDSKKRFGVTVTAGDIDGDHIDEIIVGPATSMGVSPEIRIFKSNGKKVASFVAFDAQYRGGVHLAVWDTNGDGKKEIVVGSAIGSPRAEVYNSSGIFIREFRMKELSRGVYVAAGDVDGDGEEELVMSAGKGDYPRIAIFESDGTTAQGFEAYDTFFRGGVAVAVGDIDGDGIADIVSVPTGMGGPHVRIFGGSGILKGQFFALESSFREGLAVALW